MTAPAASRAKAPCTRKGEAMTDADWKARAEAAEAEVERLREKLVRFRRKYGDRMNLDLDD